MLKYEDVPLKGCFKVKQVTVADAGVLNVNVSVTLEALQDVEITKGKFYIHVYDENMGDLTGDDYPGDCYFDSVEKGDVIVKSAKVPLSKSYVNPSAVVRYVQLQDMAGWKEN